MISSGTPEKLRKFLELNPIVPADRVFVDDSADYGAYKAMGFGKLGQQPTSTANLSLKAVAFSPGDWLTYLANVVPLSPIRPADSGVPEGVTLLGGTLAFTGERMLFASADRLPGDYPTPGEVLRKVEPQLA